MEEITYSCTQDVMIMNAMIMNAIGKSIRPYLLI